mgnify:CR=1 FL=1
MKNVGKGDHESHMLLEWFWLGPVNEANSLSSQRVNVNFVKYGDDLSDQQMRQFLRLHDIDMNRSSKKAMSVEDQ